MNNDEDDVDWSEAPVPEGTSLSYICDAIFTIIIGVSSARINPHPLRLPIPSGPLHSRQPIPLFEKSNVLVMYVSLLYTRVLPFLLTPM